jgi:hypothetical protein
MSETQNHDDGSAPDGKDPSCGWLDPAADPVVASRAKGAPGAMPAGLAQFPPGQVAEDEALATAWLHQDCYDEVPRGAEFASGGLLDAMEAGPVLALLTASATSLDTGGHAALGEPELIGALCAWRRIASWAAAGQAAAVVALARRRAAQARECENRHLAEHVAGEVAAALTLTGRAAEGLLADAAGLARLPEVHGYLAAGRIDVPKSAVITGELAVLDSDHQAQVIAGRVLPEAPSLTTGQLRARLRRLILAADPEAADRRRAEAARDAQVCLWTETSGNAGLAGRELAEADALAADRRLTALARWLSDRGVAGSLGQLRAAVFIALLHGRPIQSLLPDGPAAAAGPGSGAAGPGSGTAGSGSGTPASGCGTAGCGCGPAGRGPGHAGPGDPAGVVAPAVSGTIHLTMPLSAWTGRTEAAGEIAGYGPAAAGSCRDLADLLAASAATRWCLTLTGPAGQAVAHACAPRGHGPPSRRLAWRWAQGLAGQMAYLETAGCRHSRAEARYRPSLSLQHLIRVRQARCAFPGCRRPADRADLDHTVPFEQGGITCECNLAPLCRRHHQAKQAPGWRLTQDQPGRMIWQLPHGRSYTTTSELYPA